MNALSAWFDYVATAKIVIFGLLVGTALPALFAVGVRLGDAADGPTEHGRELTLLRWFIFALLLAAVLVGVLFIARDFIEHRIGWQWDDWGNWDEVFGLDEK
ncbi:hypothetical protein [Mycolicibacter arupensis]|uniref:Membrane protein n=1 Tax=Mycolicibacter arupensis TaxID=342002 RepID=A0A0F5N008_9MYCO|nr:hypothetical protein [Mycolicibacter arupensis]KKC00287.1 membrane protein [Mycolicibacter arupensis]MCV7276434.1 hypothetical protein [Mycolicibacter arupensis]ORA00684.1 hypothetical protein BST15_02630 [Mycolicibacter arupensis]TXI56517.1 MAG: hypothetical protein E6Q54_10185 [Mycolicibacter arupensis]